MRLDPLLRDARAELHTSPVRPDARPLDGVLLAVHAFLPVARMYRAITAAGDPVTRSRDWEKTCASVEAVHREGAETLYAHAKPTKLGAALFAEMRALAG
jgi:HEXXH motif-containing protein